jgi:glycosyltransferase involved in cell wall biosynthesis
MQPASRIPEPFSGGPPPLSEAGITPAGKLRVLLVAHCLVEDPRAGTESYVANLGKGLADLGMEVLFLAPAGPPSRAPQEPIPWRQTHLLDQPLLQFSRVNHDLLTTFRHPGFEAAFRNILQQYQVDLIHFHHTYLSSISLLEVAVDFGLSVVLTLHDAWHLCPRLHCVNDQGFCGGPEDLERCTACLEPLLKERTPETSRHLLNILTNRRQYVQRLFPRCQVLAPSRFLRNLHYRCGVAPGRIIHVPLGLDDLGPAAQFAPENPPRFVFLGNIIPVKRLDLAMQAFAPLAGQAVLEIWGGLPQAQQKPLRESLAPYSHVRYRGPYRRGDLPQILAGATALIMCSDFENYPLVARESLSLGVPVIASRAGGLPEIVRHGENGLLFPAGDAAALGRSVQRFLRHPELRERLRRGICPVKTLRQEAKELVGLYRSLHLQK